MMRLLLIKITSGHLEIFPNLREKVNSHFHTLSGMIIEPEEERGQMVQSDYMDIINKFKTSLKNNARVWFMCTLRIEFHTYTQQMDGKQ